MKLPRDLSGAGGWLEGLAPNPVELGLIRYMPRRKTERPRLKPQRSEGFNIACMGDIRRLI